MPRRRCSPISTCHYLDLAVIMTALAWLLDRVLPGKAASAPVPARAAR
jgi:hypothetical protein